MGFVPSLSSCPLRPYAPPRLSRASRTRGDDIVRASREAWPKDPENPRDNIRTVKAYISLNLTGPKYMYTKLMQLSFQLAQLDYNFAKQLKTTNPIYNVHIYNSECLLKWYPPKFVLFVTLWMYGTFLICTWPWLCLCAGAGCGA